VRAAGHRQGESEQACVHQGSVTGACCHAVAAAFRNMNERDGARERAGAASKRSQTGSIHSQCVALAENARNGLAMTDRSLIA